MDYAPSSRQAMTKPLSPAAQNVINVTAEQVLADRRINMEHIAAAALRAAADQVVPHLEEPDWGAHNNGYCDIELYTDHQRKRAQLLAIADELEGLSNA
jgi:hypothetical protein